MSASVSPGVDAFAVSSNILCGPFSAFGGQASGVDVGFAVGGRG